MFGCFFSLFYSFFFFAFFFFLVLFTPPHAPFTFKTSNIRRHLKSRHTPQNSTCYVSNRDHNPFNSAVHSSVVSFCNNKGLITSYGNHQADSKGAIIWGLEQALSCKINSYPLYLGSWLTTLQVRQHLWSTWAKERTIVPIFIIFCCLSLSVLLYKQRSMCC